MDFTGKINYQKYIKGVSDFSEVSFSIKIDGTKWNSEKFYLTNIYIDTSTGYEASTCDIIFEQPESKYTGTIKKEFNISKDFSKVKVGVKLEVALGFQNNIKPVFIGYISAFDVEIEESTKAIVTIHGMDAKIWLMASSRTIEYKEKRKYSSIVTEVFRDHSSKFEGKTISVPGEPTFETQIYQVNESDYEVICRAASKIGALFFVRLGKFFFIGPTVEKSTQGTINPGIGILSTKTSIDLWGIPKEVVVKCINPKNFEEVIEARVSKSGGIGVGKTVTNITSSINSNNVFEIIDNTVSSKAQATSIAESIHEIRSLGLVTTNLTLLGNPDIKLAQGLTLEKFGNPIDNEYIVTRIQHEVHNNNKEKSYITHITLSASKFNPKQGSSVVSGLLGGLF